MYDIYAPKVVCKKCKSIQKIVEQKEKMGGVTKLKYKCKCGCTSMILLENTGCYNLYLKDENGEELGYYYGELNGRNE